MARSLPEHTLEEVRTSQSTALGSSVLPGCVERSHSTLDHARGAGGEGGWEITSWEAAQAVQKVSEDSLRVILRPGGREVVRCVVADGLTPGTQTPRVLGMSGARFASSIVSETCSTEPSAWEALRLANSHLCDLTPELPARERCLTGVMVVDLPLRQMGGYEGFAWAAHDCECYVRSARGWRRVLAGTPLNEERFEEVRAWKAARSRWDVTEYVDMLSEIHEREPERWHDLPLGASPHAVVRSAPIALEGPERALEIVVCSDGARLSCEVLTSLGDEEGRVGQGGMRRWLSGLRDRERAGAAAVKRSDDVSVILVESRAEELGAARAHREAQSPGGC